ncbi:MAG: hypothetical protein ACOH5I_15790 [Oligoflexus sp.]
MEIGTGVSYQFVHQSFSALGGLPLLQLMMEQLGLRSRIDPFLPHSKIATKTSSFEKFKALMLGFATVCECLDDMEPLRDEAHFSSLVKVNAANTYGEYLRSFDKVHIKELS